MSIDLPTPIGLKLLNGLLGGHGHGNGNGPNGIGGNVDGDADNRADQARQSALQNERVGDASNDQGRWQTGGPGETHRGNGPHHDGHGPQGPNNNGNGVGHGYGVGHGHGHGEVGNLPNPGQVLSSALGKADAAVSHLLGQDGAPPGLLAKAGDLAGNLVNQTTQGNPLPPGLAAKALEATPLANVATAASALLTQATAQALNAPGAQALAARNALHDAASAPVVPARDTPATLQSANATQLANTVPNAARAADSALIQNRQDILPLRADQAALNRATTLPAGSPPPAAPMVATESARVIPFAAPPPAVPPSQSPALVEGRPNQVAGGGSGGDGSVAGSQKAEMVQQMPPGHTGAAPTRGFRPEEEDGESLAKRMIQAVAVWLGLAPAAAQDDVAEQEDEATAPQAADDRWLRLQWLFWALAVAGYGCLAIAVIVFIPGGAGFLDETRNPIVRPALVVGLGCSIAAWWLARKIARSR